MTAKPESTEQAKPTPAPVLIGTGMPATTLLETFGQWIYDAFGETAYHVGSSTKGKSWRDVDVRLMLDDEEFDALFPGYRCAHQRDAKWALICAGISELGKRITGLPIDFQIQRATAANKLYGQPGQGHYRNPLWLYNHASVQAEKQRHAEREVQAEAAQTTAAAAGAADSSASDE